MTKYQSKAQQVLASAVGPLVAGLRRFETEEAEGEHPQTDLQAYVRSKLSRMIFSANRSHWFSACELAIYVLTGGGHSIATHQDQPMFTNRTHYMMEECKRILNGDSTAHVLRASAESWNTVIVVNEPIEASELDSASPPQQQDSSEDSISDIDLSKSDRQDCQGFASDSRRKLHNRGCLR